MSNQQNITNALYNTNIYIMYKINIMLTRKVVGNSAESDIVKTNHIGYI